MMEPPKRRTFHVRHNINGTYTVECSWPNENKPLDEALDYIVDVVDFPTADEALAEADRLRDANKAELDAYWGEMPQ